MGLLLSALAANAAPLSQELAELHWEGAPHALAAARIQDGELEEHFAGGADRDTAFEIGSVTKVFTGLLLAEASLRGELSLQDPVSSLLPEGVAFKRGDPTLEQLSTHSSGLPRLPPNMGLLKLIFHGGDPYAWYEEAQLWRGVRRTRVAEPRYMYSNFGAGLLGQLLARAAGQDFEQLVRERVAEPLGLSSTGILPDAELVDGYDAKGRPMYHWHMGALPGAGGLDSTLADMSRWVQAWLGAEAQEPLAEAMALATTPREIPGMGPQEVMGLGWHGQVHADGVAWWHNGATGGFSSFVGFDVSTRRGVVVLSGASMPEEVTAAGMAVLLGG